MELTEHYSFWRIKEKLLRCIKRYLALEKAEIKGATTLIVEGEIDDFDDDDFGEDDDINSVKEVFESLRYWIFRHQFNRRQVNQQLQRYASGENIGDIMMEG
jgi:hypothetical protein